MAVLLGSRAQSETLPQKERLSEIVVCEDGNADCSMPPRMKSRGTGFETRSTGNWFKDLFGFRELEYEETQNRLSTFTIEDAVDAAGPLWGLQTPDGEEYQVGRFWTPSLADLELAAANKGGLGALPGKLLVRNVCGDVSRKHCDPSNRYATFQAASQFNCLEFVGPSVVPEHGVSNYSSDRTQGPACSIACGPATVFRNYFVPLDGQIGQRHDRMLNNLQDLSIKLGNQPEGRYFKVQGGYTMAHTMGLDRMNAKLNAMDREELDDLQKLLRIGVQEDAEVTSCDWGRRPQMDPEHTVTQVFGSACSVAYSCNPEQKWAPFASLVLEASYKATLYAAFLAALRHEGKGGSRRVYLTGLGGGVFGNDMEWITNAMQAAFDKFSNVNLEVYIVTYAGSIDHRLMELERRFTGSD